MSNDHHEPSTDDENVGHVTDELLGELLERSNDVESVIHQARLIAAFYRRIRDDLGVLESSAGEVHDPALDITREWLTYTMG